MLNEHVLITGACSGLGKALAQQCAKRGMNLILVELPGMNAASLATFLQHAYGIKVVVFEFDLTNLGEMQQQLQRISEQYSLSFVINNAGIGGTEPLMTASLERLDQIIALNVRSMALLTRVLLPNLVAHGDSYILNVSSMAAFTPIAYKTVYPATKAFIASFSLGLREELKGSGVSVSVLYPGAIMTNASVSRRILGLGFKGKIGLLSTDEIAAMAIRKTLEKQATIIPGRINRLSQVMLRFLPTLFKSGIVSRAVKKEIQFTPAY